MSMRLLGLLLMLPSIGLFIWAMQKDATLRVLGLMLISILCVMAVVGSFLIGLILLLGGRL